MIVVNFMMYFSFVFGQSNVKQSSQPKPFSRFIVAEKIDTVCISFGEKLKHISSLESLVTWEIKDKVSNQLIESGNGNALLDFVFTTPGNYLISIDHHLAYNPNSCNHGTLPDLIDVMVSPIQIVFDFDEITFSAPITSNVPVDGIQLVLSVDVELNGITTYEYTIPKVRTSGTDTDITANPVQQKVTLVNGKNQLNFVLSGIVTRPSYIMFDFVDPNGKIQDYTYSLLIN